MTSDALILFFKYPELGKVKTRLALSFGDAFTLGLYSSFVQDILSMSTAVTADKIMVIDAYNSIPAHLLDLGSGYRTIRQKGENIGIRMLNGFLQIFDMGYRRAVLIGSDSPDLPAEFIQRALKSLLTHDVVLGKSADGGYYLIGLKRETCATEFFSGISWSTPLVFQETIDKMIQSGKCIYLLPEWQDIDEKEDLLWFYHEKSEKGISLHTIEFLDKNINNQQIR